MNSMNNVAFGAGKSGTAFDPILYLSKPQVILRIGCWLCSIIVWTCISFNAWYKKEKRETCLFNNDNSACRFGSTIGFIGFIASTAFLALEAVFQNLSSIKLRRRAVLLDVGFSGAWSVLFLFVFGYLSIAWGKSEYPHMGQGINNCRAAIVFAFFSIATWAACSYLAYLRWQEGADMTQFTSGFDPNQLGVTGIQSSEQTGFGGTSGYETVGADSTAANYTQYTTGTAETDPSYTSNPFTAMAAQESQINYQTPTY